MTVIGIQVDAFATAQVTVSPHADDYDCCASLDEFTTDDEVVRLRRAPASGVGEAGGG